MDKDGSTRPGEESSPRREHRHNPNYFPPTNPYIRIRKPNNEQDFDEKSNSDVYISKKHMYDVAHEKFSPGGFGGSIPDGYLSSSSLYKSLKHKNRSNPITERQEKPTPYSTQFQLSGSMKNRLTSTNTKRLMITKMLKYNVESEQNVRDRKIKDRELNNTILGLNCVMSKDMHIINGDTYSVNTDLNFYKSSSNFNDNKDGSSAENLRGKYDEFNKSQISIGKMGKSPLKSNANNSYGKYGNSGFAEDEIDTNFNCLNDYNDENNTSSEINTGQNIKTKVCFRPFQASQIFDKTSQYFLGTCNPNQNLHRHNGSYSGGKGSDIMNTTISVIPANRNRPKFVRNFDRENMQLRQQKRPNESKISSGQMTPQVGSEFGSEIVEGSKIYTKIPKLYQTLKNKSSLNDSNFSLQNKIASQKDLTITKNATIKDPSPIKLTKRNSCTNIGYKNLNKQRESLRFHGSVTLDKGGGTFLLDKIPTKDLSQQKESSTKMQDDVDKEEFLNKLMRATRKNIRKRGASENWNDYMKQQSRLVGKLCHAYVKSQKLSNLFNQCFIDALKKDKLDDEIDTQTKNYIIQNVNCL